MLDTNKVVISEEPLEPSVSYYFDKLYMSLNSTDEDLLESDKVINNKIYIWKCLRILARNDLHPFVQLIKNQKSLKNQELSVEKIVEEITKIMVKKFK